MGFHTLKFAPSMLPPLPSLEALDRAGLASALPRSREPHVMIDFRSIHGKEHRPIGVYTVRPATGRNTPKRLEEARMSEKVLVRYDVKDAVAILTLDDPPANTYTHEMMRQIDESVLKARFDKDVEVIVVTGAGEKFFCAGANIGMLSEADPD